MQGATSETCICMYQVLFQSTPPMQGATQDDRSCPGWMGFNPRPLCRERLTADKLPNLGAIVSIHAPYAGSDAQRPVMLHRLCSFNPRPLCRERRRKHGKNWKRCGFQSTPPMQGATRLILIRRQKRQCFNPRPLCRERPWLLEEKVTLYQGFNPRPLCRERRLRKPRKNQ